MYACRSALVMLLMLADRPRMERPSGVCWNAVACRWSNSTSCGSFSTSSFSRRMMDFSISTALLSSSEFCRMSASSSTDLGTSAFSTLA